MSGPPYPHPNPVSGSNAIGVFQIGISPIGTISAFDPWQTVISQYANSPILDMLITCFNAAIDLTEDFDEFFDTMWNVMTAQGYGLDVWGRIVGVSRTIEVPAGSYFGFAQGDAWVGFGQGTLYSGQGQSGNAVSLSDSAYRLLILAKAATNIWDGSIPQLNQILLGLFAGLGNCYVRDNGNLTMSYVFDFILTPVQLAIVEAGILPRPAGVATSIVQGVIP
jgi:hypothetical protein